MANTEPDQEFWDAWLSALAWDRALTDGAFRFAFCMASTVRHSGQIGCKGQAAFGSLVGKHERTTRRHVRELEAAGYPGVVQVVGRENTLFPIIPENETAVAS